MSSDAFVIRAEGLSKRYRIGHERARGGTTLGDALSSGVRSLWHRTSSRPEPSVWALRDVSFEIPMGDIVGIIGPNGAGKSTLLKLLSRITEPTRGRAEVHGRLSALLEVGAGFHLELTGRENVYLSAAIMGMPRREIRLRFDEIVAFAEVERFIDTPVKHYSSGMYLRLAFSVAAHLEPDILLVDEVLAVGDLAFQKKCLGRMSQVAEQGRTVLFVSHNLAAVTSLCRSGMLVNAGMVAFQGTAEEAVQRYVGLSEPEKSSLSTGEITVRGLRLMSQTAGIVDRSDPINVQFDLDIGEAPWHVQVLLIVRDAEGALILREVVDSRERSVLTTSGHHQVTVAMPPLWLKPALYSCHVKVIAEGLGDRKRYVSNPVAFQVRSPRDRSFTSGVLSPDVRWTIVSGGTALTPLEGAL